MLRFLSDSLFSRVIARLLVVIILFNNIIVPSSAFALTGGPIQEEFTGFTPAGASDMVNLFTGDFSYNIPLLNIDGYPVNISYQSNPGIEQEASWVGLGWTLNPGAINKSIRGIPDEFKSDIIKREININPSRSWGVTAGGGVEISGKFKEDGIFGGSFGASAGAGAVYNNYKGLGYEFYTDITGGLTAGKSEGLEGQLGGGLGLKVNSQEGTSFYAQGGISGSYIRSKEAHNGFGVGANIGTSSNSRNGRDSWSLGVSGSYKVRSAYVKGENTGGGLGLSFTAVTPLSSTAFTPKLQFDMNSSIFSYDLKGGTQTCNLFGFGNIRGFFATSELTSKNINYPAYGYLYEQEAWKEGDPTKILHDYSRDKDGTVYAETPNAAVAKQTYDMYTATGQGLYGAFHASRNDIGVVYDPKVKFSGGSTGVGGEFGYGGTDFNAGLNINDVYNETESGLWAEGDKNDMNKYIGFKKDELVGPSNNINSFESAFFKFSGEKTFDNSYFNGQIGDDRPVRAKLEQVGKKNYRTSIANLEFESGLAGNPLSNVTTVKTERNNRQNLIASLNVNEASSFGIEKYLKNFPINSTYPYSPTNLSRSQVAGKEHHISEITVLKTNGSRYVYGIPVYNHKQKEVSFRTNSTSYNGGLVAYSGADNSLQNGNGVDHFYESNETPDFVHTHLLTSVLSDDYVDRNNDGVTDDDLGTFTKFNYSKLPQVYNWRMPAGNSNQAYYEEGLYSDPVDQTGSYTYGEKDIWYLHSIETKNSIALFVLEDRLDALPVVDENGGVNNANKLKRLKQIKLYSKPKFDNDPPTLVKTVNFEYEYSLCPNTPNSSSPSKGKLTLKKIWFTAGTSDKGVANPYLFFYADPQHAATPSSVNSVINSAYNPSYNVNYSDRWGQYKNPSINPGGLNNLEYPYNIQSYPGCAANDQNANMWNLNTIFTPSGSKISVDFESDDYAYVNDKRSAQMFNILGFSSTTTFPPVNQNLLHLGSPANNNAIPSFNYMFVKIDDCGGGLMGATDADKIQYFKDNYLRGETKIYFRCKVKLDPNNSTSYEYIPGYADIDINNVHIVASGGGYNVILKLNPVPIGDKQSGITINPIAKAALQFGRMYVPKVMYPGSEPLGSSNKDKITSLSASLGEIRAMIKGVNKHLALKGMCNQVDLQKSFVRLYNVTGKKYGGGSRVKQIKVSDEWGSFTSTNESTSEYGQVYDYTTIEGTNTISSGVASYEPLIGGDENSNRKPIVFSLQASASLNNSFFQEEPYCESFYPNPVVGYSKVTVKNLQYANVKKNAAGRVEHEFYTTRDYPTLEERTTLDKKRVKPKLLARLFKIRVEDKIYLSQGFVIKTNDMHGKLKSVQNFAEGQLAPISGIKYNYQTKPNSKELENTVRVLGPQQVMLQKEIGVEIDVVNDSRSSKQYTEGFSSMVNVSTMACSSFIPLVTLWPAYTKSKTEYYCSTITKTVQKFGILESVEAFENNSSVKTTNLLYDIETGEVILTSTNNQFDKDVYNFNYPGYWAYDGMGSAFKNYGLKFYDVVNVLPNTNNSCGQINIGNANAYFVPGDEVAVYDAVLVDNPKSDPILANKYSEGAYRGKCWVIKDLAPGSPTNGQLFLIDKDGLRASTSNIFTNGSKYVYKIIRSGRRNLQNNSIGTITSLSNPVINGGVTINSNVINANAVEYDDKWNMLCEKCTPKEINDNYFNSLNYQQFTCIPGTYWQRISGHLYNIFSTSFNTQLFNLPNNPGQYNIYQLTYEGDMLGTIQNSVQEPEYHNTNMEYFMKDCNSCAQNFAWVSGCHRQKNELEYAQAFYPNGLNNKNVAHITFSSHIDWTYKDGTTCNHTHSCPPGGGSGEDHSCKIVLDLGAAGIGWHQVTSIANLALMGNSAGASNSFGGTAYVGTTSYPFTGYLAECDCWGGDLGNCGVNSTPPAVDNCLLNPYVNGLRGNWRAKKSYSYFIARNQLTANQGIGAEMQGDVSKDGTYNTFVPFWYYQGAKLMPNESNPLKNTHPYDKWIKNSEVDKIDWFGNTYQSRDALDKPSTTIYGYNNSVPTAIAVNAYQNEILVESFEDRLTDSWSNVNVECNRKFGLNNQGVTNMSHTGLKSLFVLKNTAANLTGRFVDINSTNSNSPYTDVYGSRPVSSKGIYITKAGDNIESFGPFSPVTRPSFVASVWVKIPSITGVVTYPNVGIRFLINHTGSGNYTQTNVTKIEKSPIINGWQKIDYYFDNIVSYGGTAAKYKIELYNNNLYNDAYFDDLRMQPFNSSLLTKVYNPKTFQIMAELDDKNYATYYEYDEDLTVVRVKKETEKGLFTVKENRTGLKK